MNILHIPIKKKWFDMIKAGVKLEEYREIKPFWACRLLSEQVFDKYLRDELDGDSEYESTLADNFLQYDLVQARNGYGHAVPSITWQHKGIRIGKPNPEWCEPEDIGKILFILEIGERIKTQL